jgi:signal transduction histidine kinase
VERQRSRDQALGSVSYGKLQKKIQGTISVDSEYGKGTMFYVELKKQDEGV